MYLSLLYAHIRFNAHIKLKGVISLSGNCQKQNCQFITSNTREEVLEILKWNAFMYESNEMLQKTKSEGYSHRVARKLNVHQVTSRSRNNFYALIL